MKLITKDQFNKHFGRLFKGASEKDIEKQTSFTMSYTIKNKTQLICKIYKNKEGKDCIGFNYSENNGMIFYHLMA